MGGVRELHAAVHARDVCCGCGVCVSFCPYILQVGDRIAPLLDCQLTEGRCYNYCPRATAIPAGQSVGLGSLVRRAAQIDV